MNIRTAVALIGVILLCLSSSLRAQNESTGLPSLATLRGAWEAHFNHDVSRVLGRGRSGEITLWDVETGQAVPGELGVLTPSTSCVMSPDAKMAFVGFKESARIFNATTATALSPVLDLRLRDDTRPQAYFSPDGQTLVTLEKTEASIWKIQSGEKLSTIPLAALSEDGIAENTASVRFTKDGAQCFLHDGRGTVTRFDTKNWKPIGKPMAHPPAPMAYDFSFDLSGDGRWLATCDSPGENGPKANLQIWDGTTNKPIGAPIVAVNGFGSHFLPGTNRVLIAPARGEANARELPSLKTVFKLRPHDQVDGPKFNVSADGKWIVTWGPDRILNLYDTTTGKLMRNSSIPAAVSSVVIAPDSAACYVLFDNSAFSLQGYQDNYVMKMDFPAFQIKGSHRIQEGVRSVSLSPDGRRLVVLLGASDKERVVVLETATMKAVGPEEN